MVSLAFPRASPHFVAPASRRLFSYKRRLALLALRNEGSYEGRLAGPSRTVRRETFTEDIRVRPRAEQLLSAARSIP